MAKLPFEGIRVLELTTGAAGPTVGRVLCEFGAEIITIEHSERAGTDPVREQGPRNRGAHFYKLHRGKKSFTANMSTPKARELVTELIRKCDVLIENFGLGVVEKWGLSPEDVKLINPSLVFIRVKGMGCTGPHAADLTWGPNVGNIMGSTYLWNYPGSPVSTAEARTQHPDFMGGVTGGFAVVLALMQRMKTGHGQWIDHSQLEVGANLLGPRYLDYSVNGRVPEPVGNDSVVAAPYGVYRCKGEERWCTIGVYSQEDWKALCTVLGEPSWAHSGKFATHLGRLRNKAELDRWVEAWTVEREPHEVMETLQAAGVMAAAVQDVEDQYYRDKQFAANGFLIKIEEPGGGEVVTEGLPLRLSETPGAVQGRCPLMGENTEEIARELLGLTPEEVKALVEEGILV